ncbi:MAG: septum formation initiator family protein [Bacteroidetes bacterium]|nr:septum formation initiator family protein [Bacteroidota bacterium]MBU1421827.1 septum formation initiator family protein [Bacteroidota bacterium]
MENKPEISLNDLTPDPRLVFKGTEKPLPSDVMIRKNRPTPKKRPSPIANILIIFTITLLGVFAIKNIVTVNQLADEVNQLRNRYSNIVNANELLHAEINKKASSERITSIAYKEIGMIRPKEQPIWFEIDEHTQYNNNKKTNDK